MYKIYADELCIYNDQSPIENLKVIDPQLTLEDNASGSFEFILPPINVGYTSIKRLISHIKVFRDDSTDPIWNGRVLNEENDFWNRRKFFCEGDLGYLNDTSQPPFQYQGTIGGFLQYLLDIHNAKVDNDKQFALGSVTVTDPNDYILRYTNYESTLECIKEKLIKKIGGHVRTRMTGGIRYLDYLSDWPNTNTQEIRFGKNLLDLTRHFDMTELATVIIPRGARLDESPIEALDAYLTVETVNNGSIYVGNQNAINEFGWIEKVVDWSDVTDPGILLNKAQAYLRDAQYDELVLELSALDLHLVDVDIEAINILDQIRCISSPHGLDRLFPVTKMSLPLANPENGTITLGEKSEQYLTDRTNSINSDILEKFKNLPKKQNILDAAKANATNLINMVANGFITIVTGENGTQELLITNTKDYKTATNVWRWNINGLGYSSKGYNGPYETAITMDGHVVADFITTGTMLANRIRGGTLTLGGINNTNGVINMLDEEGNNKGHWNNQEMSIHGAFYADSYTKTSDGTKYAQQVTINAGHYDIMVGGGYKVRFGITSGRTLDDLAVALLVSAKYFALGTMESTLEGGSAKYYLNNGANPGNYTQAHIFYGNIRNTDYLLSKYLCVFNPASINEFVQMWFVTYDGSKSVQFNGGGYFQGSLGCSGTKYRVVDTKHYGKLGMNAWETAEAYFTDMGSETISNEGNCCIHFDPKFSETVEMDDKYFVQLTRTSAKQIEWVEKYHGYFIVYGEPGATFDWQLSCVQKGYSGRRMQKIEIC